MWADSNDRQMNDLFSHQVVKTDEKNKNAE